MPGWPRSLLTAVDLILGSPVAMAVLWGPDLLQIYNEACRPLFGEGHPGGLGQPARASSSGLPALVVPLHGALLRGEGRSLPAQPLTAWRQGRPERTFFDLAISPVLNGLDTPGPEGRVGGILVTAIEVAGRHREEAVLRESEAWLRTLVEGVPQLLWRSCDQGQWTWASPQWLDYTGQQQEETHGRGWLDAVHPDDRERTMAAWHEARPQGILNAEFRVRRAADRTWRWHQTRSLPTRGDPSLGEPQGRILEWLGTTTDIEDLKRLQMQQAVLVAELQHRTRNLLAVVRTIARRSVPPSPGRDEYDARLAALSRVQGFLSRDGNYAVPLRELIEAELQAAGDRAPDRTDVEGPYVELPGKGVQPVALALHELATNAAKYGAIARPTGHLSVTWAVEGKGEDRLLRIAWRESGVPMPEEPPAHQGYGTELITRALPYQLLAETALRFTPDGVSCTIALPTAAFRTIVEGAGA